MTAGARPARSVPDRPDRSTQDRSTTDRPARARRSAPVVAYVLSALLVGVVGGVVWRTTTPLPGYTVGPDGKAVISELALTRLFTADARYTLIALIGGSVLGLLAAALLHRRGWWVVVWAVIGPVLAGLAAWGAGIVGAVPLQERLAAATVGRTEPVDLALNAPVAVLVWPFAAVLVVLLWSAFAPEPAGSGPAASQDAAGDGPLADNGPVAGDGSVEGPDGGHPGAEQPDQVAGGDLELE